MTTDELAALAAKRDEHNKLWGGYFQQWKTERDPEKLHQLQHKMRREAAALAAVCTMIDVLG